MAEKVIYNGNKNNHPYSGDVSKLKYGREYTIKRRFVRDFRAIYELKEIQGEFSPMLFASNERMALAKEEPEMGVTMDVQIIDVGSGNQFERITPITMKEKVGFNIFKTYTNDTVYFIKVKR